MAKAYSAVLDYAGDLRMAQLAYDRWMFVLLTSRHNHARRFQLPMSYMLQDKNFTEDYVKVFRALVVDVIRQIGMPQRILSGVTLSRLSSGKSCNWVPTGLRRGEMLGIGTFSGGTRICVSQTCTSI